jgi:predicted house-cleaning NTP pyrophosphatase (Maf/HAM1 superfamily)
MQIEELIVPLCYYSERILDKRHDDEEAADRWEVAVGKKTRYMSAGTMGALRMINWAVPTA